MNVHVKLKSKLFFQALILDSWLGLWLGCINSDKASCSQLGVEYALKENLRSNTSDEISVYKYKWSQHICSASSSQRQDCKFLVFQEAFNSSISVKNGFPLPALPSSSYFFWNRAIRQRPTQVISPVSLCILFRQEKGPLKRRLVEDPAASQERCIISMS